MKALGLRSFAVIGLLALSALACSGFVDSEPRGSAPDKIAVCHKGKKTLHVAAAAAKAHYDHGDTSGPCR